MGFCRARIATVDRLNLVRVLRAARNHFRSANLNVSLRIIVPVTLICALAPALSAHGAALEWLAKHQEPDGHWDSRKYGARTQTDTATTGLALLAFLGAGNSEKFGDFKVNVKLGVAWLKSKQADNGRIFDATDDSSRFEEAWGNAIGTFALCEATNMANMPETRIAAQKAVDYCTENFPFKLGLLNNGQRTCAIDPSTDLPTVGWYVMALKSAKNAGLKMPLSTFDALIAFLDSIEHRLDKPQQDGFAPPSEYWFRKDEQTHDRHPAHRMCAIGCLCRQFLGGKKEDLHSSVERFVQMSPPVWKSGEENVDIYYWFLGNFCVFQQDGDSWTTWHKSLTKALAKNQRKHGDEAGSWDAKGFASDEWGRVGQTALGCMSVEVYYYNSPPNLIVQDVKEKLAE